MQDNDKQYIKMTETAIPRLVTSLAVPTIISMLITSVYNMADTFFVSQLGTSASGAVGIVFSVMAIIQAVGFTVGMGAGSWISRLLGKKDNTKANEVVSTAIVLGLLIGSAVAVLGLCFLSPLMTLLGATETIKPYAEDYARYIFIGAPVIILSFILNNILRSEGKARYAMIGITAGGLLNVALDPLFIYVFELGTAGAAIATLISQCVGVVLLAAPFLLKKTDTRPSLKSCKLFSKVPLNILRFGLPSLCRQGLSSISSILLNTTASAYGDAAVSAMSIVAKIFMMIFSISLGIGQGYQPVVGYNYAAGKFRRVRKAAIFMLVVSQIVVAVFGAAVALGAPAVIKLFISNDAEVVKIGTLALRAQCLALQFVPAGVLCNMTFQSIGKSVLSAFLSSLRQGIFFIPLIIILPKVLGITGVQITQALADILNFIVVLPFLIHFIKNLPKTDGA